MPDLKCTCRGKLNDVTIKGDIEADRTALDNAVVMFQTSLAEQPGCDAPCTNPPHTRYDWTMVVDTKDPDAAPDPAATVVDTIDGPSEFKVIFARDARYALTISVKLTVECDKLIREKKFNGHGVRLYQRNGPPLEDEKSLKLQTVPF